ncbi:MAG: creatininase family protein [Burkholderiales bacterium]|nr:creatininase family protein [Burkholderiales bacterium]
MALATVVSAHAQDAMGAGSVNLEDLTWTELREQVRTGSTTILVPIGGTEQNGPYMALGKHNVRARLLAERIARTLGHALVAPVVAYVPEGRIDPPTAHMRFPGTITVPEPVFEAMLESAAQGFKQHGFKRIVFLGEHGGYQQSLKRVEAKLNRQWAATSVRAHAIEAYYRAAQVDFAAELQRRGYTREEIGTHAGLLDTSLSMALAPNLVRAERLHVASKPTLAEGAYGDPRRASPELGRLGIDIIVRETVQAIRQVAGAP